MGVQPVAVASWARCARIVELDRSIAVLTAERASLLVAERDCGEWKKAGYASFEAWRGQMSGEGLRTARAQLSVATVLEESPEAAEAVTTGKVTVLHVEVLGRVRAKAEHAPTGTLTGAENRELLDLAKGQDADTFAKTADRWWARRDSVAHDATHEEIRRKRFLTIKNGAAVRPHMSLIMTETTFVQAHRELSRRAAHADATAATGAGSGVGVGSGIAADGPDLFSSLTDGDDGPGDAGRAPLAGPEPDGSQPVDPVTFEDGTPVPLSEVARILCDAEFTRIVMTSDNVPINLGRTGRLYTREQRRAIIARDRGCQFHGCTQAIPWCEIHHIDWWTNGGVTSLDNAILLCSFHHHEVHRLNLTVDRSPSPGGRPGGTRTVRVARGRVTDRRPEVAECTARGEGVTRARPVATAGHPIAPGPAPTRRALTPAPAVVRSDCSTPGRELQTPDEGRAPDLQHRGRGPKVLAGEIDPGQVFDADVPLADVAEAYRLMDSREARKVIVRP